MSQDLILQQLKNISEKFGQPEHQAARDKKVLTGLVNKVNQQSTEGPYKKGKYNYFCIVYSSKQ